MARTFQVDIVTPERLLYSGAVEMVMLPGSLGQMGVLPGHAPLLTTLDIGEITLKTGNDSLYFTVSGGVVEVRPNKVTILADTAENPDEIDADRAQQALDRAERLMASNPPPHERPLVEAAMRRSSLRLKVARKHQGRRTTSGLNFEQGSH